MHDGCKDSWRESERIKMKTDGEIRIRGKIQADVADAHCVIPYERVRLG